MNKEKLFQLYEKLYFDEIERREKIYSRLQLPLAILILIFGILAYMLQNASYSAFTIAVYSFWVLFLIACGCFSLTTLFFKRSWLGYTYRLLPTPEDTEKYRKDCIDLYKDYENCDELVDGAIFQYLFDAYVDYSSWNMANNDARSLNLEKTGKSLLITFLFCILTFGPFFLGGLDKSKNSTDTKNTITKTQVIKKQGGVNKMVEITAERPTPTPPPPPPPPPPREIRDVPPRPPSPRPRPQE